MTIYNELKSVNVDAIQQVEEIVALLWCAQGIRKEFEAQSSIVEVPEWLDDKIRSLGRELKVRTADVLEKRLREAQTRRAGLMTTEEKRKALDDEIARLTSQRDKVGV